MYQNVYLLTYYWSLFSRYGLDQRTHIVKYRLVHDVRHAGHQVQLRENETESSRRYRMTNNSEDNGMKRFMHVREQPH